MLDAEEGRLKLALGNSDGVPVISPPVDSAGSAALGWRVGVAGIDSTASWTASEGADDDRWSRVGV